MASNLGVNYAKTSGKARHKWTYRMMCLRAGRPSFRSAFRTAVLADTVLQAEWTAIWDNIAGYLASRGVALDTVVGSGADPRTLYEESVADGKIPYNLWSGQSLEGMSADQAKTLALQARKLRCRFELLFDQWHNMADLANIVEPADGDGGEGGPVQ